MIILAKRIRSLRLEASLSVQKMADIIGVSKSSVTYWENGSFEPKTAHLIKYAEYFNVSVDYLLGLKQDV